MRAGIIPARPVVRVPPDSRNHKKRQAKQVGRRPRPNLDTMRCGCYPWRFAVRLPRRLRRRFPPETDVRT
jgi:hypothetical protein